MEQMSQLDAFVQARIEEPRPPMVSAARTPGRRPSAEEDPLNAWMWKCRIEGAADGLLKGKTVSFKDHIAIAGMDLVTELCDPVIVMAQGRTLLEGPFAEVRRDPRVLEAYLGTAA